MLFTIIVFHCIILMVILMKTYCSSSEIDTESLAYEFAKSLKANSLVVISGELGAGKTKFVKGIAKYFGIENDISSPTFTIVNEHVPITNNGKVQKVYHFDVYRLTGPEDFVDSIGLEYFDNELYLIEWGEVIKDILPKDTIWINISKDKSNDALRKISIEGGN